MNTHPLFNFIVEKDARTIAVERVFAAPLDPVWAAWTEADILCRWWAPKPYTCVVKSLDFREGGRWLYFMEGPEGDRHWSFFDYESIRPKTYFAGQDGFCDEQGRINASIPSTAWESHFSERDGSTLVKVLLRFVSAEALEKTIEMGFKEGFTAGLQQLDELLADQGH